MRSFLVLVAAGSLAALLAAGCGSDLKCGAGTHAANNTCVQDNPMDCDLNTAEIVDGVCQAKSGGTSCGPGTKQNPVNPEECIPDCGAGTSLDPVTKKCVPDGSLVQPNVTEQASDENNDPLTGGTPIDFTLPAAGASTILAGTIGAPGVDADGYPVADFDGWQFTTTGPTLLEIEGLAVSHIRFAFLLTPASDPTNLLRFGFNGEADQEHRRLWVPSSGDWVINVSDADNVNALLNGNAGYEAAVGADDATFNYAFRVTNMAVPDFDNLQPSTPMTGSYADGVKFYSLTPTAGMIVEFWNSPEATDVYPTTDFYTPQTTYKRPSGELSLARAGSDTLYFVADYMGAFGSNLAVTYEAKLMQAEDLGELTTTALVPTSSQVIASAKGAKYYKFTVTGDALIVPRLATPAGSDATPAVALYDAQMNPIIALTTAPGPVFRPATGTVEYIVRVTDANLEGGSTYTFDLSIGGGPVTATAETESNDTAGTANAGTGFPLVFTGTLSSSTDVDYYSFTLPSTSDLVIMTTAGPTANLDTIIDLYDSTGTTQIDENDDIDSFSCILLGDMPSCLSRIDRTAQAAGTYLIAVASPAGSTGDYQLIVTAP